MDGIGLRIKMNIPCEKPNEKSASGQGIPATAPAAV
jgi:hypothetical protein